MDEPLDAGGHAGLEKVGGSLNVYIPEPLVRNVDLVLGRREMIDDIDALQQFREKFLLCDGGETDPGSLFFQELPVGGFRRRVFLSEDQNRVPALEAPQSQPRPDESRSTGDQHVHLRTLHFRGRFNARNHWKSKQLSENRP